MDPEQVTNLIQFLRSYDVATLATVKEGGQAHGATVFFYVDNNLRFYFLTRNETGKFKSLRENPKIGLVISDPQTLQTVQVEGVAKEVDYVKEYASVVNDYMLHLTKSGKDWAAIPINHMLNSGYYAFVQVTPTWIRWTDFKDLAHTVKLEHTFE